MRAFGHQYGLAIQDVLAQAFDARLQFLDRHLFQGWGSLFQWGLVFLFHHGMASKTGGTSSFQPDMRTQYVQVPCGQREPRPTENHKQPEPGMMKMMHRAILQRGGPVGLEEAAIPEPGQGEILINVAAAGLNRPDLLQISGLYPPPPGAPETLGLEVAGEVAAIGLGVQRWKIGDRVVALLSGGGYATYALAPEGSALPWPEGLSAAEAAALPEGAFTVWANVFEAGALAPDEAILIHGGASGIGTLAIQMAKAHGARVFTTVGSPEKAHLAQRLGAERAIVYKSEDFEAVMAGFGGTNVVLDMVGGKYVQKNIDLLLPGGRLVFIAFLEGSRVEIDLMRLMLKRLVLTGSTLRARPNAEKARLAAEVERVVWPWIAAGQVKPVIDRTFPLAQADAALAYLQAGQHAGKIVLTMEG